MVCVVVFILLMLSCCFSQCCKILLANQANPSDQDVDGLTPADLAEYNGHYECVRYLRAMEKNVSSLSPTVYPQCILFCIAFTYSLALCLCQHLLSCLPWHENQSYM